MEDKDIQILMNQGWQKMAIKLDEKMPVHKKNKRRFFWLFLLVFLPSLVSILAFWANDIQTTGGINEKYINTTIIPKKQKPQTNELIADNTIKSVQSGLSLKKNLLENNQGVNNLTSDANSLNVSDGFALTMASIENNHNTINDISSIERNTKNKNIDKTINYKTENIVQTIVNPSSDKIYKSHLSGDYNHETSSENSIEYSNREILSIAPLEKDLDLLSYKELKKLPDLNVFTKPYYSKQVSYFTMGLKGSMLLTGIERPLGYNIGAYVQQMIKNGFFVDGNIQFRKYDGYVTFLHNNGQYQSGNKDMDLLTGSPGVSNSGVFSTNSKSLNSNQINEVDESILSNSLESVSFINTNLALGYRINSSFAVFSGIGLDRMISSTYKLNVQSSQLYQTLNKTELTLDKLRKGDELLRKWLFMAHIGSEYNLNNKVSIISQVNIGNLNYVTSIEIDKNSQVNSASTSFNKGITETKTPENGNIFLEIGIKYRLR